METSWNDSKGALNEGWADEAPTSVFAIDLQKSFAVSWSPCEQLYVSYRTCSHLP